MKKQFGEYQRLARGLFGCSSLWRGEDHLLYVRGSGFLIPFSEEYLRFRFKDIQALVIVGTSGRLLTGLFYAIGALMFGGLCALILSLSESGEVWPLVTTLLFPFPVAMLFLLLFVRTLILGQRCIVEVQTSLKRERFRMLTRLPFARRVLDSLEVEIQQAQEEMNVAGNRSTQEERSTAERQQTAGRQLTVPVLALPAFAASMITGVSMLLQIHMESAMTAWMTQGLALLLAPLVLVAIAASVRQLTADGIRFALWGIMGSLLAMAGGGFIFLVSVAVDEPDVTVSPLSYIKAFTTINSDTNLGFYLYFMVIAALMLGLGIIGLLQIVIWKRSTTNRHA
jgi:asparagine N-glycosylation enzyme membrane subunit Stt3